MLAKWIIRTAIAALMTLGIIVITNQLFQHDPVEKVLVSWVFGVWFWIGFEAYVLKEGPLSWKK